MNRWFTSTEGHILGPPNLHLSLPIEFFQYNFVIGVPVSFISNVAFIFHLDYIVDGKYLHTCGLKNLFNCQIKWDSVNLFTSQYFLAQPYFYLFDNTRV